MDINLELDTVVLALLPHHCDISKIFGNLPPEALKIATFQLSAKCKATLKFPCVRLCLVQTPVYGKHEVMEPDGGAS
jgi:hypothetical protein